MRPTHEKIIDDTSSTWTSSEGAAGPSNNSIPPTLSANPSPTPQLFTRLPSNQLTILLIDQSSSDAGQPDVDQPAKRQPNVGQPDVGKPRVPATGAELSSSTNGEPTSNPRLLVRSLGDVDGSTKSPVAQPEAPVLHDTNGKGVITTLEQKVVIYQKAAEEGDATAQSKLGVMYMTGEGVEINFEQAAVLFRRAAEQGNPRAQFNLGQCYLKGKGIKQDTDQALVWYRKSANQGNARAQATMGHMYAMGIGVNKSLELAFDWFRKAAELGNAMAQVSLGFMYENGKGIEKSTELAAQWYREAAERGDVKAQMKIGLMCENGIGVEQDVELAAVWYHEAAEVGHAEAQVKLGSMYAEGRGVEQDVELAAVWYRKAADQGDARAQMILGDMYQRGHGVEQNVELAAVWYRKAAEQGDELGQIYQALMYACGVGVQKDAEMAAVWYRKAAEQGNHIALRQLGLMYERGSGVKKDVSRAAFLQMLSCLVVAEDQTKMKFNSAVSDEVMACIPDLLNDHHEFHQVKIFELMIFDFSRAAISAIDRLIRLNKTIQSISIHFYENKYEEDTIDACAKQFADAIQASNTSLTKLDFGSHVIGEVERARLDQLLEQNQTIAELSHELYEAPPKKSDELPLEVLNLLADQLIVTSIRGGKTMEAAQVAVNEFLISTQFGMMTSNV
jgi:TPR repeat protein